jgi:hypothetical protein
MTRARPIAATGVLLILSTTAAARGVTPYLPLNLDPQIERQIERVLILGDRPVLSRPIPAAVVLEALPKACAVDPVLCGQVSRYLQRFMHTAGITYANVEGASTSGAGAKSVDPNRYGMREESSYQVSAQAYLQPSDYVLLEAGAVVYEGHTDWTGTMASLGWEYAQLDVGYRPHWLSPLTGSSMLMSTEAPTMPSWTISNYEPLTSLGITYQIFEARMSHSDRMVWEESPTGFTSGNPLLGGFQIALQPANGWSFAFNRLVQFGGGARGNGNLSNLFHAIFNPSRYSNTNAELSVDQKATNQEASFTSSLIFPGQVPFEVYAEYAGEDTSRGKSYLLGNSALSWGIHFPRLFKRFDLTLEASEWQNAWYTSAVWLDGMTNYGIVISNWLGDQRLFGDGVGGRSAMAQLWWDDYWGGQVELRYRTLQNQVYGAFPYQRYHDFTIGYSHPWDGLVIGAEFDSGKDVFGGSFTRLAGFVRFGDGDGSHEPGESAEGVSPRDEGNQLLLEAGINEMRVNIDLSPEIPHTTTPFQTGAHLAVGARRAVSDHSDLGTHIDYDQVNGAGLLGVRLIDYRYRFANPLALTAFFGAARYNLATPAYGYYFGLGLQWRDILPHVDLTTDLRWYDSVARDHLLPSDPQSTRPDSFYDIWGGVLALTYHF